MEVWKWGLGSPRTRVPVLSMRTTTECAVYSSDVVVRGDWGGGGGEGEVNMPAKSRSLP